MIFVSISEQEKNVLNKIDDMLILACVHSYFVGSSGLLVHNAKNEDQSTEPSDADEPW